MILYLCAIVTFLSCAEQEPLKSANPSPKKEVEKTPEANSSQPKDKEDNPLPPTPPKKEDNKVTEETPKEEEPKPLPPQADKPQLIFAKGVSLTEGWYDVDKLRRPEDIMTCWLITASNMLQWWQDRYTDSGATLPAGTPNGRGNGSYGLSIFDEAIKSFASLNYGGDISNGISWYVRGHYSYIRNHAHPKRKSSGGYLKTIPKEMITYPERSFLDYDAWAELATPNEALKIFSEGVTQQLHQGSVLGMDIKTHVGLGGGLHAITIWGAEMNSSGLIQALYITDSDDFEKRLVRCPILAIKNPSFSGQVIAMDIPISDAYTNGARWEILRLTYLSYNQV